jgi:hypothetical protein
MQEHLHYLNYRAPNSLKTVCFSESILRSIGRLSCKRGYEEGEQSCQLK